MIRLKLQQIIKHPASSYAVAALFLFSAWAANAVEPIVLPIVLANAPVVSASSEKTPAKDAIPDVTSGFTVSIGSREQVRDFYNAVYTASDNLSIYATANVGDCIAGTNATAYSDAVIRRINWFRAMAGAPADVAFSPAEASDDQDAALMASANGAVMHVDIPPTWSCYTTNGTNASANSNLALGVEGADAITYYMWDYGAANSEVGHRRWLLYPQTRTMATGDVPVQGSYYGANATWIQDENYGGPRPPETAQFVAWPPPGYTPYSIVFPQWSFALSNADFSVATVSMTSNSAPLAVTLQTYTADYGEDTLVWYPSNLDPTDPATEFPFAGSDTVYTVTINNVRTDSGPAAFNYNVTLFDPGTLGTDYVATAVSGPTSPSVAENNLYSCTPLGNSGLTSYQWLVMQATNGNLADNAQNGLVNFTVIPAANYSVITNPPAGTGKCFHLCHTNAGPQIVQLNETIYPSNKAALTFKSLLGYATTNETARVQISTNGGTAWHDLFTLVGNGKAGQTSFSAHSLPLSNYVGDTVLIRFNYDFSRNDAAAPGGQGYYPYTYNNVGWCLENIVATNTGKLLGIATNVTSSTNFNFVPPKLGSYELVASGVLFSQFPMDVGLLKTVNATTIAAPTTLLLGAPQLTSAALTIPFTEPQGTATTFELLQASDPGGPWTTNTSATLTTNLLGSLYSFSISPGAASMFYKVHSP